MLSDFVSPHTRQEYSLLLPTHKRHWLQHFHCPKYACLPPGRRVYPMSAILISSIKCFTNKRFHWLNAALNAVLHVSYMSQLFSPECAVVINHITYTTIILLTDKIDAISASQSLFTPCNLNNIINKYISKLFPFT